jgi:hypothetical protein
MTTALVQRYEISRKPKDSAVLTVAEIELQSMVKKDMDMLSSYLDAWGAEKIDTNAPFREFYIHFGRLTNYFHLKDLTLKVDIGSGKKDWMIPIAGCKKAYKREMVKDVDLYVSIYGKGSKLFREYLRKNIFGPAGRKVIDARNPKPKLATMPQSLS